MRTLVDLVDTEHGYARIFYGDSYGYELHFYRTISIADLFESMSGYASIRDACEAARHQLCAMSLQYRSKDRKGAKPAKRGGVSQARLQARPPSRPKSRRSSDGGSMGLL
jgi:hypothetical protein